MKNLKNKLLILLGMTLSSLMIFVLGYTVWKVLFYVESEKYGMLLSRELSSNARRFADLTPSFSDMELLFESFDYFPKDFLNRVELNALRHDWTCHSMTDVHSLFRYSASVTCQIAGQRIRYHFVKTYDTPTALILVLVAGTLATMGMARFFLYVDRLQDQNLRQILELQREQMMLEVGAKLVHDIKKGVLAQLNTLYQEFGQDLDLEIQQSDFVERFQRRLKQHFQSIDFLNKYINLLTANLRREKESHWVQLDESRLTEYLNLIFSNNVKAGTQPMLSGERVVFVCEPPKDTELRFCNGYQGFWVPEMSFFRILKNISENFNAYGQGALTLEIWIDRLSRRVHFKALNPISRREKPVEDSSNLGLMIIRQLLVDNFGADSKFAAFEKEGVFILEMDFLLVERGDKGDLSYE